MSINYINKLFKEKDKNINFFTFNKKVYFVVNKNNKNISFGISNDGFNFNETKNKKIEKIYKITNQKTLIENKIFERNLIPGSETIKNVRVEGVIKNKEETFVFFDYEKEIGIIETGVVVFDTNNLNKILWWGTEPIWQSPKNWQGKKVRLAGLLTFNKKNLAYWQVEGLGITVVSYPKFKVSQKIKIKNSWFLKKENTNPLITPNKKNDWEAFTTFNPAAVYLVNKVYLLYRAQGFDYKSVLGFASSSNGIKMDEKLDQPAYIPRKPFEKNNHHQETVIDFMSGGGCEGCEDPRITKIGKKIYMTYVAFNGFDPPRIALTSIKITNFLKQKWLWKRPVLISQPNIVDKSACILPKKINNKYVIFHRIFPNILVDYVDSLDFKPGQYLKGEYKIKPRSSMWWDSRKIGVAAPPVLTKDGWLLIYQSVDDKNSGHYQVGAMMLKTDEPHIELYRSRYPIMEPDQWYENDGFKAGVVYPCGAVIIKDQLFVYYGGADSYVCVATTNLNQFLNKLKEGQNIELEGVSLGVIK